MNTQSISGGNEPMFGDYVAATTRAGEQIEGVLVRTVDDAPAGHCAVLEFNDRALRLHTCTHAAQIEAPSDFFEVQAALSNYFWS